LLIFRREDGFFTSWDGPGYVQGGVIPQKGAFPLGGIIVCGFVDHFSPITEHIEPMGKARWNPQESFIFGG
jgi:hypothetical protein